MGITYFDTDSLELGRLNVEGGLLYFVAPLKDQSSSSVQWA